MDHDVNYLIRRAMMPYFGARIGHFFSSLALAMLLLAMASNTCSPAPEFQSISFSHSIPQFDGTDWAATVFILQLCLSMCTRLRTEMFRSCPKTFMCYPTYLFTSMVEQQ